MIDLSPLPTPMVVETLDYEAILSGRVTEFKSLWEAVRTANPGLNLPQYDVQMLETDPAMILLQEASYDELRLRARVNDAARANLLRYAASADLDHVAADHGVTRLVGETDAWLRERIILADQAKSCGGPEEWYKFHARSASVDVRDVAVFRPGLGPQIEVAVLSRIGDGTPSGALLTAVSSALNAVGVKVINDILSVTAAVKTTVNISAQIWLLPDTPMSVFSGLESVLRAAHSTEGGLGFDLNLSWLISRLSVPGVSKVAITSPTGNVVIDDHGAVALGTVALTYMGVSR